MTNIVTIFSSTQTESKPFPKNVSEILTRIKTGEKSKALIEKLRNETDTDAIDEIKKLIPVICFSAELYKISDDAVNNHSGIICLDFCGYKDHASVLKAKAEICEDDYVYAAFVSVSGMGLKVLVKIPADHAKHTRFFSALKNYFDDVRFDKTAYNVSRACYDSYDPDIYINEDSDLWDEEKPFKLPTAKGKSKAKAAAPKVVQFKQFWGETDKGKIYLDQFLFKDFLVANGFYKFYPEESKNFVFVRKISNRVANITDQYIKDFVLNYIEFQVKDESVWSFFADKTRYFKEDFLSFLPKVEIKFVRDTMDSSYVFFKNTAVKVTKDLIETTDYEDLEGWVWEDQMVDRDFVRSETDDCDFKKFIHNISDDKKDRIASVESTIGFLLHSYKDPSYCPAVILNDEVISDNPEGGTGKGLFANGISQIRKMVNIDGKTFRFDKSFLYQTVQQDTQILTFDDVKAHFQLEMLFSVITEGITLEKKNKDAIKVPFSHSPKVLITTNYAIRGSGNSFERRKWELEFKQFYTKEFTPKDEFGHRLFDDWTEKQWMYFDNYMLNNLSSYIKTNFITSKLGNQKIRKFIAETSHEFHEWMKHKDNTFNKAGVEIVKMEAFNSFVQENPDFNKFGRHKLSNRRFNIWMDAFGDFKFGIKPGTGRNSNGQWLMFEDQKLVQKKLKL
jgi:hypothetical protein